MTLVQNSIMTLVRRDTKGSVIGIFSQIHTGEEVVRERALRLIHTKFKTSAADLLNKECQVIFIMSFCDWRTRLFAYCCVP